MMQEGYDTAQICINGHVITSSLVRMSQFGQEFCSKCGAETISKCPACNASIRGHYWGAAISIAPYVVPNFCHGCGKPYPWMESKLKAAKELSDELDNLSKEERELLKKSLDGIVRDTPQTQVSAMRFKKLMAKAGSVAGGALRDIIVDIASETAKKIIWPS